MTNLDWTDRTLLVTERLAIAQAEIADRSDLYMFLEDCSVVIRTLAHMYPMQSIEETMKEAMRRATGPKGEPWFPRD